MKERKQGRGPLVAVVLSGFLFCSTASGAIVTLGQQDFVNGQILNGSVAQFNAASVGEAIPFDRFRGSDPQTNNNFNASWTFNFGAAPVLAATITFGIFALESGVRQSSQVETVDAKARNLKAGRLVQLSPRTEPLEPALYFVCAKGEQNRPVVRLFRDWLRRRLLEL